MMYKKTKGFSLAELLISLLIISIVLAAAIPTITRRNAMDPEKIWNWGGQNNVAYFGAGHNQSAIIGYDMMPYADLEGEDYRDKFFDKGSLVAPTDNENFKFTTAGDRLVLVKRFIAQEDLSESFVNSHISFYNIEDRSDATTRDLVYAGRIASDQHNLAFGIGSLLSYAAIETDKITNKDIINSQWGYNTSLGHYTLSFLKQGTLNTAVGESALTYNFDGHSNTATGAFALNQAKGSDNTAFGANAGKYFDAKKEDGDPISSGNTLIGAHAMSVGHNYGDKVFGSDNTAVGAKACGSMIGDGNICIGSGAGAEEKSTNILEGFSNNYSLFIGNDPNGAPLIHGHTTHNNSLAAYNPYADTKKGESKKVTGFDKELNVNAKYFRVKPYDGSRSIFEVEASAGDPATTEGYETNVNNPGYQFGRFGRISMALKDSQGEGSAFLSISGSEDPTGKKTTNGLTRGIVNMYTYDPGDNKYISLNINDAITILQEEQANAYAKDGKEKLGKIYSNDFALILNDAIRVEKGSTTKKPFIMVQGDTPENQALRLLNSNDEYLVDIYRDASASKMYISPAIFSFGENTEYVTINGKEEVNINAGEVWFKADNIKTTDDGDIQLPLKAGVLNATGKNTVAEAIKAAYDLAKNAYDIARTPSDARLKNISGDSTAGLKEINALEVKNYTYKKDEKKTPHVGVIAQQLQKVFPNSVFEGEDGYLRIKTEEIFYAMVNSIKELFAQVQDLTAKVVGLDKRITELEKENAALKKQNEDFEKRLSKLEAKMAK